MHFRFEWLYTYIDIFALDVFLNVDPMQRVYTRSKIGKTKSGNLGGWVSTEFCSSYASACRRQRHYHLSVRPETFRGIFLRTHGRWPQIWYADISWLPSEVVRFWWRSVDFSCFGVTLTWWKWSNLSFPDMLLSTHGRVACNLACWCIQATWTH